jgi:hypothetical protein
LLTRLGDTAQDDIVDRSRIEACAMQERIQHFPGQVRRVPACQSAIATATGRAHRLNDESLGHITQLLVNWKNWPAG